MLNPPLDENHHTGQEPTQLLRMVNGYMISQIIYAAVHLGLPDSLGEGAKTSADLAQQTATHEPTLRRLLRALTSIGIIREEAGSFALTPLGEPLRPTSPNSLHATAGIYCNEIVWRACGNLVHSVRSGEPAFEQLFNMPVFEYFASQPKVSELFNKSMAELSSDITRPLAASYDFSQFHTLIDVGGGDGTLIAAILDANPTLSGILFDTPAGTAVASETLKSAGVADRCKVVAGDFFTSVPPGGDIYILKNVIHDWNDERGIKILRACRTAMIPTGRLLLIEPVLPVEYASTPPSMAVIDLQMLVMTGGKERTEADFQELFKSAGLTISRIGPTLRAANSRTITEFNIIEGTPASDI